MFGLLRSSKENKLRKRYRRLLKEAYSLSHVNRKLSDAKYAEAEEVMTELDKIRETAYVQ